MWTCTTNPRSCRSSESLIDIAISLDYYDAASNKLVVINLTLLSLGFVFSVSAYATRGLTALGQITKSSDLETALQLENSNDMNKLLLKTAKIYDIDWTYTDQNCLKNLVLKPFVLAKTSLGRRITSISSDLLKFSDGQETLYVNIYFDQGFEQVRCDIVRK